jgi:hypothetical protein
MPRPPDRAAVSGRRPALLLLLLKAGGAASTSGRGFGDGKQLGQPVDLQLLSGVPWWYNWGLSPGKVPGVGSEFSQEFVAMAWGARTVLDLPSWQPHSSTKYLLGFNEPNLYTQANLTGSAACQLWGPVVSAAKRHGLQVGSPAANHCQPSTKKPQPGVQGHACWSTPEDWFDSFFSQPGCGLETVDFITTHKYGCNATDTIAYVKMLHDRYRKPVRTPVLCGGQPLLTCASRVSSTQHCHACAARRVAGWLAADLAHGVLMRGCTGGQAAELHAGDPACVRSDAGCHPAVRVVCGAHEPAGHAAAVRGAHR